MQPHKSSFQQVFHLFLFVLMLSIGTSGFNKRMNEFYLEIEKEFNQKRVEGRIFIFFFALILMPYFVLKFMSKKYFIAKHFLFLFYIHLSISIIFMNTSAVIFIPFFAFMIMHNWWRCVGEKWNNKCIKETRFEWWCCTCLSK